MSDFGDIRVLVSGGSPVDVVVTPSDERSPIFSPDGRWLAYVSNESGRDDVYLQPYPGTGRRMMISNDGGVEPAWSHDGRELYYRNGSQMLAVSIPEDEQDAPGLPRVLFEGSWLLEPIGRGNANYDVAADGRFLMAFRETTDVSRRLHVVLNWFGEVSGLVPDGR